MTFPRGSCAWLLLTVSVAACNGESASPVVGQLPANFRLVGTAESTFANGRTVRCQFAFHVELGTEDQRTPSFVRYPALHGGSAGRTVRDAAGSSFSFIADVHWPQAVARFFPPDSVELLLGDTTTHDSRFWLAIAFLGGRVAEGGVAKWTCAPFDIHSSQIVDTSGVAVGTWRLEAQ